MYTCSMYQWMYTNVHIYIHFVIFMSIPECGNRIAKKITIKACIQTYFILHERMIVKKLETALSRAAGLSGPAMIFFMYMYVAIHYKVNIDIKVYLIPQKLVTTCLFHHLLPIRKRVTSLESSHLSPSDDMPYQSHTLKSLWPVVSTYVLYGTHS